MSIITVQLLDAMQDEVSVNEVGLMLRYFFSTTRLE
jgi:hypothetical protein